MLTITPEASNAIRGILDASDAPDGSMLRISAEQQDGATPGPSLGISLIDSPPPDDQIVTGDEVAVCVEPTVAAVLDDKELDANVVGGQINFSIGTQDD